MLDLEIPQKHGQNLATDTELVWSSFLNIPSECLSRMETFDGRILQKRHRITEFGRCTQEGEIPRTEAIATLPVAYIQEAHPHQNLAMDQLGLVTNLVEPNFPSRCTEVSGPLTLKGAATLQTGEYTQKKYPLLRVQPLSSAESCHSDFVHIV